MLPAAGNEEARTLWQWSEKSVVAAAIAAVAVLFAIGWATREDRSDSPYLHISGGGFIFNYRNAEAYYGFTAEVARPVENGAILEASFDDPAGGPPIVVRERLTTMTRRYAVRTPPLRGIEAGKPYKVSIKVYDRQGQSLIWQTERSYVSQVGDEVLPEAPLTVGPGYHQPEGLSGEKKSPAH